MDRSDLPCLCFPCILSYLGGYIFPTSEDQFYPVLEAKGFSKSEQAAISEEWYWVAVERDTAVKEYLNGNQPPDGCTWRPPPPHPPEPEQHQQQQRISSPSSTPGSTPQSAASS